MWPLAPAVTKMVRLSPRGYAWRSAILWDLLDEVRFSAPCGLVGSTASCTAPTMNLRARLVRAAVRAGRHRPRVNTTEFPLSATSLAAHLPAPRPRPKGLNPTGRKGEPSRAGPVGACPNMSINLCIQASLDACQGRIAVSRTIALDTGCRGLSWRCAHRVTSWCAQWCAV